MIVQPTGSSSTNHAASFPRRRRGRSPRLRTNIPSQAHEATTNRKSGTRPPTAYQVMYATNPSATDVAALAGYRIAEVEEGPRRHIILGLLAIVRTYLLTMDSEEIARRAALSKPLGSKKRVDVETRTRRAVVAFRDLIGSVARNSIPAQTFLSRARDILDDAKAFRQAVELATGVTLLTKHDDGNCDDTNFKLGRDKILEVYVEPELTAPDAK